MENLRPNHIFDSSMLAYTFIGSDSPVRLNSCFQAKVWDLVSDRSRHLTGQ